MVINEIKLGIMPSNLISFFANRVMNYHIFLNYSIIVHNQKLMDKLKSVWTLFCESNFKLIPKFLYHDKDYFRDVILRYLTKHRKKSLHSMKSSA